MKKLILGLFLFSISLLGYSETATTVNDVKTVAQDVANQVVSKEPNATVVYVTEKLQQFVESLKVPAEKVFSIIVKKEYVYAWSTLIVLVVFFISGFILLKVTNNSRNKCNKRWRELNPDCFDVKKNPDYNKYDWDSDWWIVGLFASCLIMIVVVIGFAILSSDIIIGITNPEYGAIKEIMQLF